MKRQRRTKGRPTGTDIHVGQRVKARRIELGMSQTDLGKLIGITFQQLQKNERGVNRFSASRLHETARALDVPVAYFFEGLPQSAPPVSKRDARNLVPLPSQTDDPERKHETQEMVRAYYGIRDRKVRQQIVGTMRALARTDNGSPIHARPRRGRPPHEARA